MWRDKLDILPEHMREGMAAYIEHGIEPGGFLTSVLANDLMEAIGRADIINRHRLYDYCNFIYNYVPLDCHGSYKKVDAWVKAKRETKP